MDACMHFASVGRSDGSQNEESTAMVYVPTGDGALRVCLGRFGLRGARHLDHVRLYVCMYLSTCLYIHIHPLPPENHHTKNQTYLGRIVQNAPHAPLPQLLHARADPLRGLPRAEVAEEGGLCVVDSFIWRVCEHMTDGAWGRGIRSRDFHFSLP